MRAGPGDDMKIHFLTMWVRRDRPREFVKITCGLDYEDEDSNVGKLPPSDSESDAA